jgi:tetratricopeptide (TPR) repeat protein
MPPKAREAIELARRGELAGAILSGEAAAREAPDNGGLRLFVGMLHARRDEPAEALPHLRSAAALMPGHPLPRLELARALIGVDRLDDAERVIEETPGDPAELLRVRALLHARRGAHAAAADCWREAIDALMRALALRPDQPALRLRLVEAQAAAGQAATALEGARALVEAAPRDPLARVALARLEDLAGRPAEAEAVLRGALAIDPACAPALLALADLAERDNRLDELETLLAVAAAGGIPPAESALLRSRLLSRRGDFGAALAAARSIPQGLDGGGRAQAIGRACDKLGRHAEAFAAFAEMNEADAARTPGAKRMAQEYREEIDHLARTTTPAWYGDWAAAVPVPKRPPPFFVFGFPRSGTTLLDTMLAGHEDLVVLEERPVLHAAARRLRGGIGALAGLDEAAIAELRAAYFEALDAEAPEAAGKTVIDKLPLGIADAALVHRLFPDAGFVFAERHPCDVILSGFMTRFDARGGMANFLDLQDLARLYDRIMAYWAQCRAVFPLSVHNIRYERMIADPESELRPLAGFLGLDWEAALLDHVGTARTRRHIGTPSYAQVAEPLYTSARGRWEKYREQLAPVLPRLAPWCERMGYAI